MSIYKAFDEIDRPSSKIIDDCVHCGFCLSACPTYLETGNELDSPRGRIYLIKSAAEGKIDMGESLVNHLDLCLGCLACETACPSGVKYGSLIERSRAQIERRYKRKWHDRLFKAVLFRIFPYASRLKLMLPFFYIVSILKIKNVLKPKLLFRINPKIGSLFEMLPEVNTPFVSSFPEVIHSKTKKNYKVGFLTGCVQSAFFSKTNHATVDVLTRNGCEVFIPRMQGCCGALSIHSGRLEEGRKFARKLIDIFSVLNLDAVIVNSAGCGSSMKEYSDILKNDPAYKVKAEMISGKTKDIMEFLCEIEFESKLNPLEIKVTYQDACHIVHGQGIRNQPRELLKRIPGLKLLEMKNSDHCCGSAGIYNIMQPEMSKRLLSEKLKNIEQLDPDYLVAGNPGCLIQIKKGIDQLNKKIKTAHPVELLYWSINGKIK
ncbi:MAG: (Fe-S)-binding protein [Thermodesulfobacteriota bacterium]